MLVGFAKTCTTNRPHVSVCVCVCALVFVFASVQKSSKTEKKELAGKTNYKVSSLSFIPFFSKPFSQSFTVPLVQDSFFSFLHINSLFDCVTVPFTRLFMCFFIL